MGTVRPGRGQVVTQNQILASLPPAVAARLTNQSTRRSLTKRTVLYEAGEPVEWAYFPLSGMVSLLSMNEDGDSVEVSAVGREGMIGLPILLERAHASYSVQVQLPMEAIQVRASLLRAELKASPIAQQLFVNYLHVTLGAMSQLAVCHRFHTARQRLCRWLLTAHDHASSSVLQLTQEEIGQSLGVPRTGITAIAVELQDAGALHCRHGRVTIVNRAALECRACDCYRQLRDDRVIAKR